MFFSGYKLRMVLAIVIGAVVAIGFGVGELWRCARVLIGPTAVAFSPAGMNALATHGYVRVTGVRAAADRMAVVADSRPGAGGAGIRGAYLPLLDATDSSDDQQCVLLAWDGGVRNQADVSAMTALSGPNGDEIVGFVMSPYDRLDPARQRNLAPVSRVNVRNCWVIDVHKPSWLKGLGLTLLGLGVPGGWVLWRSRRPIADGW